MSMTRNYLESLENLNENQSLPILESCDFNQVILQKQTIVELCTFIAKIRELFDLVQEVAPWLTPERVSTISNMSEVAGLTDEFFTAVVGKLIDIRIEGFDQHDLTQPTVYLWEHHNHAYDSIVISLERFRRGYEVLVSVAGENLYHHPVSKALMQLTRTLPFPRERPTQRSYLTDVRKCYRDMNQLLEYNYSIGIAATGGLIKQGQLVVSPHLPKLLLESSNYHTLRELTEQVQFVVVQNHFSHYPGEYYRARRDVLGKQPGDDVALVKEGLLKLQGINVLRFSPPLLAENMNFREFAEHLTLAFFDQRPIFPEDVAAYNWMMQQQNQPQVDNQSLWDEKTDWIGSARSRYDAYMKRMHQLAQDGLADAAAQMRYGLLTSLFNYLNLSQDMKHQHELLIAKSASTLVKYASQRLIF